MLLKTYSRDIAERKQQALCHGGVANTVDYSPAACQDLKEFTSQVYHYIVDEIDVLSCFAHKQMCVIGWTINLPDHLYRAMKLYGYSPSIRVIFHLNQCQHIVTIDRVGWRDLDVYKDGH